MSESPRAAFEAAWAQAQAALQSGNAAAALPPLQQCLQLQPQQPGLWLQTAVSAFQAEQGGLARQLLQQAAQRWPQDTNIGFHFAYLCELGGDLATAVAQYRRTLEGDPNHAQSLHNLAGLLARNEQPAAALDLLQRLIELNPADAGLQVAAAELALQSGAAARARTLAGAALLLAADDAAALRVFAKAARHLGDLSTALPALQRALAMTPERAGLMADLGQTQIDAGDFAVGRRTLQQAATLDPQRRTLDWLAALALPALPLSDDEIDASRADFAAQLERIHAELRLDTPAQIDGAYEAICRVLPFPLHYQPRDNCALGRRYGDLVQRVMQAAGGALGEAPVPRAEAQRLRVGFVSAELREHTVTRYFGRWLEQLDAQRFERHAWHCGAIVDATTQQIAQQVDFFQHAPFAPLQIAQRIRAAQLDVVVLLDVGMDAHMHALAALPLAPRQYLAYGHPVSSGLPGLSGFLSSERLESAGADGHYREPLLRLPGLGALPRQPRLQARASWQPRRAGAAPQLLCAQNLGKLIPAFDATLARIAAESGAQIAFYTGPAGMQPLEQRFLARIGSAFRDRGLDPDQHLLMRARTSYADYLDDLARADLVLDSPWFCGGATSLDACHVGVPVVTWEGEFLRSRQTAGMLRLLDLPGSIADNEDGYIARALELIDDAAANRDLREALRARAPRLFDAGAGLDALADLLGRRNR
ncbi:putative O-linked N-acetylglucosamine transferase (SPINDLY family) [Tahibacter aquaticus]|uniref:protein O-GlcNAc transferase n=1 Tax=Tahibacter aquaticus TaxID=520092 RepID=A0A4R6Z2B4_9GAMM|nr:tetratricopeptide repeat protein [Tahibacter aquaticus]TDR45721.1 putative O-linked N-acetylglucosamine transferase (SPINDLY family) [Tahibacter aquaticus]